MIGTKDGRFMQPAYYATGKSVNEFVLAVFESDENVAISYIQIATIISFYLSLICSQSASKQNIRNRYIFNRIWVSFRPIFV